MQAIQKMNEEKWAASTKEWIERRARIQLSLQAEAKLKIMGYLAIAFRGSLMNFPHSFWSPTSKKSPNFILLGDDVVLQQLAA